MRKSGLILLLLALPALTYGQSCRYDKDIDFVVDAAQARSLLVDVGAGELIVRGDDASSEVRVSARACAGSESALNGLDVGQRRNGDEIEVYTEFDLDDSWFSWWRSNRARIDIEMTVPAALALRVDDSSGETNVSGVASLEVNDGAGSIRISDIAGDVSIDDGSGSIRVSNIAGLVTVEDGSGSLRIEESDAVRIIDDGSGSIHIADISQDVRIDDDGSGSIVVRNVGGDVQILDSGSGGVTVDNVEGSYSGDSE